MQIGMFHLQLKLIIHFGLGDKMEIYFILKVEYRYKQVITHGKKLV